MGKRNKSSLEAQNNNQHAFPQKQRDIFFTVLSYCLLIIVSPIVVFFGSKHLIFDNLFDQIPSNIWAAVSAIVALHVALGAFLYRAYFGDEDKTSRKQD